MLKQGGRYATLLNSLASKEAQKLRPDIKQLSIVCTDCAFHQKLDELTQLVDEGKLRPYVQQAYELADVSGAVTHSLSGHTTGKVAIVTKLTSDAVIERVAESVVV